MPKKCSNYSTNTEVLKAYKIALSMYGNCVCHYYIWSPVYDYQNYWIKLDSSISVFVVDM